MLEARFAFDRDRRRFIVARGRLRQLALAPGFVAAVALEDRGAPP
jgi:hypothetical protein